MQRLELVDFLDSILCTSFNPLSVGCGETPSSAHVRKQNYKCVKLKKDGEDVCHLIEYLR